MPRLAIRVEAFTALVHTAHGGVRESLATPRVLRSRLSRRLPSSTNALRIGGAEMALYKRQEEISGAHEASRVEASSNQGGMGGISHCGEAGRRTVSSASLPQYLSAIRQMYLVLCGAPVPSCPFVWHVLRGYKRWEEDNLLRRDVRCGLSASTPQYIWAHGMGTNHLGILRDSAMCVFAFCMSALRESSVASLEAANVVLHPDYLTARLSVVKGQPAGQVQRVKYHRVGVMQFPVDQWQRWNHARGRHRRFFALPDEQMAWSPGAMNRALRNCLKVSGIPPPSYGIYSSHSLRIGAHTEQVLLGIPLEVRLARFGWGPNSQEMANLYFDRTIQIN